MSQVKKRVELILLVVSAIALLFSLLHKEIWGIDPAWVAILLCGIPIILEAIKGLVTEFDITADVLVAIALCASIYIGETFAAGEVALIMQFGSLLEDITVSKAKAGIEQLMSLSPQKARCVVTKMEKHRNLVEQVEEIGIEQVHVGQILRVFPGEMVPADGVIVKGQSSINQAVMTGESIPVDKVAGDEVISGTINQFGSFDMKVERVGEDSSIQRMIQLVKSADAGEAKIVKLADRWAVWIVIGALVAAIATLWITHEPIRAVTILVVFCPCSLVLATPTAIVAATGNATKHGFLIRQGDALERLASVTKVAFDKTGTITYGKPKVTKVQCFSTKYNRNQVFAYIAAAEQKSEHPLGRAIVESYKENYGNLIWKEEKFEMAIGQGIQANVNGHQVLGGNMAFLKHQGIKMPSEYEFIDHMDEDRGSTKIYVAIDCELVGSVALMDQVRKESSQVIQRLKLFSVKPVLLTGDQAIVAEQIGQTLDIEEIYAQCLPQEKLHHIRKYQEKGERLAMVGDGINDAPALKAATVGIAMGGIGSDIAVDAADIVLIDDKIAEIPYLMKLSREMLTTIRLNLTFSMLLNFIAILLAISGIINPVIGALVHNAGSVFVILNSVTLLGRK